jgi:hypothetical protein
LFKMIAEGLGVLGKGIQSCHATGSEVPVAPGNETLGRENGEISGGKAKDPLKKGQTFFTQTREALEDVVREHVVIGPARNSWVSEECLDFRSKDKCISAAAVIKRPDADRIPRQQ